MRNSKIFFDGVFLSIYLHILKKLEFSKLCRKNILDSKNSENGMFQKSHLIKKETYFFQFMLQDVDYSSLVLKFQVSKLKSATEVIKLSMQPQKCVFLKRL